MRFLLDENFPKAAGDRLQELGFEVFYSRSVCKQGSDDSELMTFAIEREAVILTTDRDFFHTLAASTPNHFGIVVIALKLPSRKSIVARLDWFLDNIAFELLSGRAFQLRDKTWVCHPSIEE